MLVAQYQTVLQFEQGESDCECGPFAVALNKYAGQDGPAGNPEEVDQLADTLWNTFSHSSDGIDVPTLLKMLDNAGMHYQKIGSVEGNDHVENLTHETALNWLRQGHAVICTVNESNVIDLDLGESPYPWLQREPYRSNPPNHIFTLAGIADDGNVLVADPANGVVKPGIPQVFPRRYQLDRLNFITLVAVDLQWRPDGGNMIIDLNNPVVAGYFSQTPDGQWQCKRTGFIVQKGILAFYRSFGQNAYCGLTYLGLPLSNEIPIQGHSGVVEQKFERALVTYDPNHELDHPPGSGAVYLMHIPN
jgi:hypothetical protein